MQIKHPTITPMCYESLWQLSSTETYLIKETWVNHHRQKKTHISKKNKSTASLVVSEAQLMPCLAAVSSSKLVSCSCSQANRDVQDTYNGEDNSEDNIMHIPETRVFDNSADHDRISDFMLQAHNNEDNDNNNNIGDRGADSSAAGNGVGCSPLSKPLEVASFSQNNNNSTQYSPLEPPTPANNLPASTALLTSPNVPAQELPRETLAARETADYQRSRNISFPLMVL
jgi:hypothetical protein